MFHLKAGALQEQLGWPTSVLLVLYSSVVLHVRQLVSPSSEKVCAAQARQTTLALATQTEEPSYSVPAGQAAGFVHAAQGARPVELHVEPLTQGSAPVLLAVFQAYPFVTLQPQVAWPVMPSET